MPTNRRRMTRLRSLSTHVRSEWRDWIVEFMQIDGPLSDFADVDDAHAYWLEHGEAITAGWIAEHPGTRPAPWWHWTHGESRPIVNPLPPEEERRVKEECTWDGVLHATIYHGWIGDRAVRTDGYPAGMGGYPMPMLPWQEPEDEYLDRKGLLTDEERQALGPA